MSNLQQYHVSKNLLNPDSKTTNEHGAERFGDSFPAGTYYVLNNTANNINWRDGISTTVTHAITANTGGVITTTNELVVWHFNRETDIMVAESSVAIPFEPYDTEVWHDLAPQQYINGEFVENANIPEKYQNGSWS